MIKHSRKKIGMVALALVAALAFSAGAWAQQAQQNVEQKVSFYLDGKVGDETVKKDRKSVV